MATLAGGNKRLLTAAQEALQKKDYRWAAQLADCLLQFGVEAEGRRIKAEALEAISRNMLPITGKNYLIRSAMDLRKEPVN